MKLTLIQGHLSNDWALGSGKPKNDLIQKTWLHSLHQKSTCRSSANFVSAGQKNSNRKKKLIRALWTPPPGRIGLIIIIAFIFSLELIIIHPCLTYEILKWSSTLAKVSPSHLFLSISYNFHNNLLKYGEAWELMIMISIVSKDNYYFKAKKSEIYEQKIAKVFWEFCIM